MTDNRFERITFRGHTMDRVTARAVEHGDYCLSHLIGHQVTLPIFQGCYTTANASSSGTHAGSGAIDAGKPEGATWDQVQHGLRLAGWDAWHRTPLYLDGKLVWTDHVHAILLGDPNVSDAARKQVQDYYAHLSGLAGHAADDSWHPAPIVRFAYPMPKVNLANVTAQFKHPTRALPGVRQIQRALNTKTGTSLVVDGIAGPKTRAALGRWEKQNGGDGDGIPGGRLWLLGAARFEVA